jgi:hypothetical protein
MVDLSRYRAAWNDSFVFTFVDEAQLSNTERVVFGHTRAIVALTGARLGASRVRDVLISETMRLSDTGNMIVGLWQPGDRTIVVRRDQLAALATFAGTLLHELAHALSGEADASLPFEAELTRLLGIVADSALSG